MNGDPFCRRQMFARIDPGCRFGEGHLRDLLGRRSSRADQRSREAISEGAIDCRRSQFSRSRRQGDSLRRGAADRFGFAARSPWNRLSAPSVEGSSRDSHRHELELFGDRQAHRGTKVSSRRCPGNCLESPGSGRPLSQSSVPGREYFRLPLGGRTQGFTAGERTDRAAA